MKKVTAKGPAARLNLQINLQNSTSAGTGTLILEAFSCHGEKCKNICIFISKDRSSEPSKELSPLSVG